MVLKSARIEKLRQIILNSEPTVGTERAWIVTEAYEKYKDDPILIKRAKVLKEVLSRMSIYLCEGDLLAGNQGEAVRCPPVFPENSVVWMTDEEMDMIESRTINPLTIPDKARAELKEIAKHWQGKTLVENCYAVFPDDVLRARRNGVFSVSLEKNATGHCVEDYEKLLRVGFIGLKNEIAERLARLSADDPDYEQSRIFLEAADIVCEGVMIYADRYSEYIKGLAEKEADPVRKKELERLSYICSRVPAHPAEGFYEAVQSVYMAHMVSLIETNAYSMSFGRFDQYIYPYYRSDIDSGKISVEEAQEILNCFWVRINDLMQVDDSETIYFHGGHPFGQHLTVGGMDKDGNSTVNELSYMCLDAHEAVRLHQPDFSVRVNGNTPREFKHRTAEVIRLGLGLPQLFNDEIIIRAVCGDGVPVEEARNYTPTGCVENSTPNMWVRAPGGWFNMPKILELCMHEGRCGISGVQIARQLPPVEFINSFDQLMELYYGVLSDMIKLHVKWSNEIDDVHKRFMPQTAVSVLIGDCIENCRDVVEGGARYNFTSPLMVGIANITDSLMFIKRCVFEKKLLSFRELKDAIDANYVGYDKIRLLVNNFSERFGNDIEEVDALAADLAKHFHDEFAAYENTRGGKFRVGFWSVTANFNLGMNTLATADGRLKGEPLSDSLAPNAGKDVSGLTASLCSVAKVPQYYASNGTVLNRHLTPAELSDDSRLDKLIDLVDGYFALGGSNIGFNIVSADTLRAAKKEPAKYADLMVKVAGYAAYFTELGEGCQDNIIERTEHHLE